MEGVQDETFDIISFKDSVLLLVSGLAKLLQNQGKAIQRIETGTNKIFLRIKGSLVSLKANASKRPGNVHKLPGLQLWEIVGSLSCHLDDLSAYLCIVKKSNL